MAGDIYTTSGSGMVWKVWIAASSVTSCTASVTGNDIWPTWCTASDSSTSTATTWHSWNSTASHSPIIQTYRETPEQIETRRKQRVEYERQREALERAESSLLSLLSPEQRESYAKDKKFHVITAEGKRYEIDCRKRMHNVFELNERGQRVLELCIYQTGNTPLPDNIAAQKLLLESDEKEFRRIANHTRLAHAA